MHISATTSLARRPIGTGPSAHRAGLSIVGTLLVGLLLIALAIGAASIGTYNGLVDRRESVDAATTEIQNQYKRRFDLIPDLVATVKGAANFEKDTITAVTNARAKVGQVALPDDLASDPEAMTKFMDAQGELGGALGRLLVVAENYPTLTATEGFRDLQSQLEGTENRISVARGDAIAAIKVHNAGVKRFPATVLAGMFGFEPMAQLDFSESVQDLETSPTVDFSDK